MGRPDHRLPKMCVMTTVYTVHRSDYQIIVVHVKNHSFRFVRDERFLSLPPTTNPGTPLPRLILELFYSYYKSSQVIA